MKIPMSSPELTDGDIEAVMEVLEASYLSIGPKNKAFEESLAAYVGTKHAVTVNSGTSGLHLAVIAAGIKEGDLVITTPFSFIASANCILFERAIPVFVDIDPATYNMDPLLVARAVEDIMEGGKKAEKWLPKGVKEYSGSLKAILAVDAFGQPAEYDSLKKTAGDHDLILIEDSCESLGGAYKGRNTGTLGDVGVFAFYSNKQMTTGEGGILVTDREDWAALFRSLRNQGRDIVDAWLNHTRLGYNYRLDEMSAALGLSQLQRIDKLLAMRAQVAAWYTDRLKDVEGIQIPKVAPTTSSMSWFVYVIRITADVGRNQLMEELGSMGIPSRPYFTPIHLQPFYVDKFGYRRGDYPETESAGDQCLALPFSSIMKEDQVETVCKAIEKILGGEG